MRKLSHIERVFNKELEPHIIRNKERNHKRHLKNTLFDYREHYRNRYNSGSMALITLVKAGIPYKTACQMLNKTY